MHPLTILAFVSLGIVALLFLLVLFEPPLRYQVDSPNLELDSDDFIRLMAALTDSPIYRARQIEMLSGGAAFYEAELREIALAKRSIHVEAFIFHPSAVGDRFLTALVERARHGVAVKVVIDAIGSFPAPSSYFGSLQDAGGEVRWYQPLRFETFKRMNNRTHRELIVIDGRVGFVGGAGIGAHWDVGDGDGKLPWRDMMFRVEGDLAAGLQTTFAENWLESSGQILAKIEDFPRETAQSGWPALVVTSSPTSGRSTRNRVLFQTLIASAKSVIRIHSPYFLPDRSATAELVQAVRRGVNVQIVVPGSSNNHPMTRLASRRRYGPLLEAGVEIYEFQPGMIHTKSMTVDGTWVVVGSTNFDSRSFDLNDEVNVAVVDRELAEKIVKEFQNDLAQSERMVYEQWCRRSLLERVAAQLGRVLERQE